MPRILVHVEGQTEERFVNTVLAPYLQSVGYTRISARLLGNARQRTQRGGIRNWDAVRRDILHHLKEDSTTFATTMVDYYALPGTWPGRSAAALSQMSVEDRAGLVNEALLADISNELGSGFDPRRFIPYVVMHEFEGLLFSDPVQFSISIGRNDLSPAFQTIRDEFSSPEHINDFPDTAPSKRVLALHKPYQKILMGVQSIGDIGLDIIRKECPIFNTWIETLEERARP